MGDGGREQKCQHTPVAGQITKKVWSTTSSAAVSSSSSRIRTTLSALITMTAAPKSDGAGLRVETGGGSAGGSPAIAALQRRGAASSSRRQDCDGYVRTHSYVHLNLETKNQSHSVTPLCSSRHPQPSTTQSLHVISTHLLPARAQNLLHILRGVLQAAKAPLLCSFGGGHLAVWAAAGVLVFRI